MTNSDLSRRSSHIINLMEQIEELKLEIKDAYENASSEGFTASALRAAIKIHRLEAKARDRHDKAQSDMFLYLDEIEGKAMAEAAE